MFIQQFLNSDHASSSSVSYHVYPLSSVEWLKLQARH